MRSSKRKSSPRYKRMVIQICVGSSCHIKGAPEIVELLTKAVEAEHYEGIVDAVLTFEELTNWLKASLNFEKSDLPPVAELEGADLVTEGVITVNRVLEYARDYLGNNEMYEHWNYKRDGASLICQLLFEEATDINFYVGRAINPAHQNPDLPITFSIKMNLVEELSKCLRKMGKRIKVSYF